MKVIVTARQLIDRSSEVAALFDKQGLTPVFLPADYRDDPAVWVREVDPFDGWIIGDEKITASALEIAVRLGMKAAVKWGRGLDNIDLGAARSLALFISEVGEQPGESFEQTSWRAISELLNRHRLKALIQRNATSSVHQRFAQFDI